MQINSKNSFRYLSMLLKHGNFTKAAQSLYISQSYLTQTIKKIEEQLGIEIINRQTTPLRLTEAGKLYYEYLNSLQEEQLKFQQDLAKYKNNITSTIRLGVLSSLGSYILPKLLPEFVANNPDINLEIFEESPKENEKRLLNGDIDFMIGQNPETISPNLNYIANGLHGYFAVIPKTSKFYCVNSHYIEPDTISIKELLNEPLILTTHGSAIRQQLEYLFEKFNLAPKIILESNNIYTISKLAQQNLGITFIPESLLPLENGVDCNLYALPIELISLTYFIAHIANKTLNPCEKNLINLFKKINHQSFENNNNS